MSIIILSGVNDTYIFDGNESAPLGAMGKVYKGLRQSDVRFAYERGAITGSAPEIVKLPKSEKNALYVLNNLRVRGLNINKFTEQFRRLMEHTTSDRTAIKPVAIKVLFSDLAANPMFVQRFERESQIKIKHPNIVEILDYVVVPPQVVKNGKQDTAKHHIVMEYLRGESLEYNLFKSEKPFNEKIALEYIRQLLEGLNALHKTGITHRDIKPNNTMITTSDSVKIMDFGVVKLDKEIDQDNLTSVTAFIGTISYASPEQINNLDVGPQSDIWACGIILFEMLTKRRPFEGDTADDTKRNILNPQLHTPKIPGVSPGVNEIIYKSTQKDIHKRYQNTEEFLADLASVLYQNLGPAPVNSEPTEPITRSSQERTRLPLPSMNLGQDTMIIGSVLITVLIVLFFIFFGK